MDKQEAMLKLRDSFNDLINRQGKVTIEELETEVINLACLEILKNERKLTSDIADIGSIIKGVVDSNKNIVPISKAFQNAALELWPKHYSHSHAAIAALGIPQNVLWEGMWNHLRKYFKDKHDTDIDGEFAQRMIFASNKQSKFIRNKPMGDVQSTVKIIVDFLSEDRIKVSIAPGLDETTAWAKKGDDFFEMKYISDNQNLEFEIIPKGEVIGSFILLDNSNESKIIFE